MLKTSYEELKTLKDGTLVYVRDRHDSSVSGEYMKDGDMLRSKLTINFNIPLYYVEYGHITVFRSTISKEEMLHCVDKREFSIQCDPRAIASHEENYLAHMRQRVATNSTLELLDAGYLKDGHALRYEWQEGLEESKEDFPEIYVIRLKVFVIKDAESRGIPHTKLAIPVVQMGCWFCGTPLIWGGDNSFDEVGREDDGDGIVANFSCPNCGASAECSTCPEEEQEDYKHE